MIRLLKKTSLFILLLCCCACIEQDDISTSVPEPEDPVNFTVSGAFIPADGTYRVTNGQGYKAYGVVLFNYGQNNFRAFDLTCPSTCLDRMDIDASGIMTCHSCGDVELSFTQYKTSVSIDGKTYSLREYYATLEGNVVRISNY